MKCWTTLEDREGNITTLCTDGKGTKPLAGKDKTDVLGVDWEHCLFESLPEAKNKTDEYARSLYDSGMIHDYKIQIHVFN